MAPPPTSPPSSPPSELGEISPRRPRRGWRRLSLLRVRLGVMMMGEGFRRRLLQVVEPMVQRVVRQEMEKALCKYIITPIPRQLVGGAQHARYYLKFQNKICDPLHTFKTIEGEAGSDVEIALFDNDKKVIVTSDPLSSIKVEIVVLNGDFNNDDRETWSEEEFNKRIALPRDKRGQLLKGERFIKLNNGIGSLGDIAFTDNSSSQKTKKFRLGVRRYVRYAQSVPNGERIQEGITEPLRVKDRRVESTQKHHTPSLDDEVWRLKHIRKDGIYHERLQGLGIKTVQDFLRYYNSDKSKLRNILGRMSESYWKEIVKHAKECDLGDKLYSFSMRENSVVPDSVESWKNLAYGNISGMQFDHRMIDGNPMPLLSSDVTFLPRSRSLSHIQIRNSDQVYSQVGLPQETSIADQVYSQVGLLQEISIAGQNSRDLFREQHTSIDLDNHQTEQQYTSFPETNVPISECTYFSKNLPLEMGNSSFDNISTPVLNSRFPDLLDTHYAPEARYESQTYLQGTESLKQSQSIVKDASSERDNSLDFNLPMEIAPIQQAYYEITTDEPATQVGFQNQDEPPPVMDPFSFSPMSSFDMSLSDELMISFSPMSSLDMNSFDGLIPGSSCGETSHSVVPPSPHPRWVKLLAPIKWVHFTKKRRARILIPQTLVATV